MSTLTAWLIVTLVIVLLVFFVALYYRFSFAFYFAVMESYDVMSFEWQFEEEVIERILNRGSVYVKRLTNSKLMHTFLTCMLLETPPPETYKADLIRTLLSIMQDEKLVESVTYRFDPEELRARWHHVDALSEAHKDRYVRFMTDDRFKHFKRVIEVTLVRKLPKGKKGPPQKTSEREQEFRYA